MIVEFSGVLSALPYVNCVRAPTTICRGYENNLDQTSAETMSASEKDQNGLAPNRGRHFVDRIHNSLIGN